jgi:hypothetical protein
MNNSLCLTDDQLDEVLIAGSVADADLTAEAITHLSACDLCQERLAASGAPLAGFREVSLAWAERRSATMPRPAGIPAGARQGRRLAWASVATAVLAIGIAIPMAYERGNASPGTSSDAPSSVAALGHTGISSVTPAAATPDQIARDNQMLQEIDRALDAPTNTPAEYGLLPSSSRATTRARSAAVRD